MDEYVQYNTMCTVEYVHCTVQYSITNYTVSAQYIYGQQIDRRIQIQQNDRKVIT